MEKCKKHHKKILSCDINHYGEGCDCLPKCEVCLRVQEKEYAKIMKRCNWVAEVNSGNMDMTQIKHVALKYKPRNRLKKGQYATLDMKTGYLVKAKGIDCRFYVVK